MDGKEALGELFEYDVSLVSEDPNVEMTRLLGMPMVVHLDLLSGEQRHFHGYVTSIDFVDAGTPDRPGAVYRAIVRPWTWFLTQTTNCRIFQDKTVPEIVAQVFRGHGFSDFEESLTGNYPANEYIVQYRETDFNFISRLLERAGIYYFFRHTASAHTLVLADAPSAHAPTPGCETLPCYQADDHRAELREHADQWRFIQSVTLGSVTLRDYDFKRPNADLTVNVSSPGDYAQSDKEVYDYPGDYLERANGLARAGVQLEQRQDRFARIDAHANARPLSVGGLFTAAEHKRDDQNRDYLVTSTSIVVHGHDVSSVSQMEEGKVFSCDFLALPSDVVFRPTPAARRPVVEGPQTALVVGPDGQEIWTDKYGRVKVQFHWDRQGERNENSSCWVRVSQVWAGSNWGGIHIPRIGQEVIVDFLEGDPDRPIITGRVYNGANMPPYALPAHQTQSGIKSRSTKGGSVSNANEIRFEDLKGHEELYIQAEKTQRTLVKGSQAISVGGDRAVSVSGNEAYIVKKKRETEVTGTDTTTVHDDVEHDYLMKQTVTVGTDYRLAITGNCEVSTGDVKVTNGKASIFMPQGGDVTVVNSGGNIIVHHGESHVTVTPSSVEIKATGVTIKAGDSTTVDLSASGVTITGQMINLNS
jgi:type VI secretion system secreted protein VgrG